MNYEFFLSCPEGLFMVSDERALLDFELMQQELGKTYWTPGISMDQLRRQVDNSSLAFGLYELEPLAARALGAESSEPVPDSEPTAASRIRRQVGFARVISDLTRFAYLSDVIIIPELQRRGLGQRLCAAALAHHELQDVRRWVLMTDDAQGVYEKLGFQPLGKPDRWMELRRAAPGEWI